MIDYVILTVSDFKRSVAFYASVSLIDPKLSGTFSHCVIDGEE
jgi:hypothetical protein